MAEDEQCPGCELLETAQSQLSEKARGMKVFLVPNTEED